MVWLRMQPALPPEPPGVPARTTLSATTCQQGSTPTRHCTGCSPNLNSSPAQVVRRSNSPLLFSQHAFETCALYGVNPELVRVALAEGETFLDRPWVAVLTPDDAEARRAGGRWLFLNR
jgi:hypothetical protein